MANPYRIGIGAFRAIHDIQPDELEDYLDEFCSDSVVPALCKEECEVEPDGRCEHDCPSILLALNLI